MEARVFERDGLAFLLAALQRRGYTIVGPTERSGAIVYEELAGADDLPAGRSDVQEGATYRLIDRDDGALFGFNVGPTSFKQHLFPPTLRVWRARSGADGKLEVEADEPSALRYAFLGVRACDLHAIEVQDRVFLTGEHVDDDYAARRQDAFIVAVNCGQAASTCFCVSMGTGPRAERGFDLALTELISAGEHRFLAEVGTEAGRDVLADVPTRPAEEADERTAAAVVDSTAAQMGRTLDTDGIKELLYANLEHPRWEAVADRCLSCGNCTMVCPTCFCRSVDDVTDLAGTEATRTRRWESCFTLEHSYVHGGSVRATSRSRYRQWMTHKLATWIDQFGTSGCVGCGRCITWCPVAIDITEEAATIRASDVRCRPDADDGAVGADDR